MAMVLRRAAGRGAIDCGTDVVAGRVLMNVHHVFVALVEQALLALPHSSPLHEPA